MGAHRLLDEGERLGRAAVVRGPRDLVVRDHDGDVQLSADAEGFLERVDHARFVDQLQRENFQLKEQLIGVRTQAVNTPRPAPTPPAAVVDDSGDQLAPLAINPMESPIAAAPEPEVPVPTPAPVPVPAPVVTNNRPAVQTPAAPVQPPVTGRRYVVQKGDSLYSIAKRHSGTANTARVQTILSATRGVLPTAAALQPGMTLVIP